MPKLTWIGKEKVINHHLEVPYRVLQHRYGFHADNAGDNSFTGSGNMIIHGDNLESLKALLPYYSGGVKCIYIDPPYNTGNEGWVYNDNVNDPHIQKWLHDTFHDSGVTLDDLTRHDKWLCMMYPRLSLLQQLLKEDGAIFISIDDNELANLKLICDEIFGARNFVEIFAWRKTYTPSNLSNTTKKCVEYILCYAKNKNELCRFRGLAKTNEADNPLLKSNNQYKVLVFPKDIVSCTLKEDCYFKAGEYGTKVNTVYLKQDVEYKNGKFLQDIVLEGKFIWKQETLEKELANHTKIIFKGKSFAPRYDRADYKPEVPRNLIDNEDFVGTTEEGGKLLTKILGRNVFDYPKTPSLIEYIINFLCDSNSIILDSFAGSGTTAHAVLNLNKKDGGNRKFILVEMEDYADNITAERVRRVMNGYADTEGTGGAFDFYELGETMFNADGSLNEAVGEDRIREYVYYTDTKQYLSRKREAKNPYLLDTWNGVGYYLYYEKGKETTLNYDKLSIIKEKAERYIVYADTCTLDKDYMTEHKITFRKIPRDIQKF